MTFKKRFNNRKVNVLGTDYTILILSREDDPKLDVLDGYTDTTIKKIVVYDFDVEKDKYSMEDLSYIYKKVLRHELVHAFFYESGLSANTDFADNEICVDWIAMQTPKMSDLWLEMGILK